jgi:hypothetical protein
MESYKHSCPFCGQHVEYTAGYCGTQMQCPICGHAFVFPAIPPGSGTPAGRRLALARKVAERPALKWSWNIKGMLVYLRDFEHWNVVGQCLVPFLIVGALLAGAVIVKKNSGNPAAPAPEAVVQVEPGALKKMTDLTKADDAVKAKIQEVKTARALLAAAQQAQTKLKTTDPLQRKSAEKLVAERQCTLTSAEKRFQDAYAQYQKLGGTVNYRSQEP